MIIDLPYNPRDWYWIVAGSTTQVFSSKTASYVPVTNAAYVVWLAKKFKPTKIATEAALFEVLSEQAPECLPNTTAGNEARRTKLISTLDKLEVGKVLATIAFDHENRIRVLEKKATVTKQQFLTALKAML